MFQLSRFDGFTASGRLGFLGLPGVGAVFTLDGFAFRVRAFSA